MEAITSITIRNLYLQSSKPTVKEKVYETFRSTLAEISRILHEDPPDQTWKYAQVFDSVAVEWTIASVEINKLLIDLKSEDLVASDAFRILLRAENPTFYFRLLMAGMTPLPDEENLTLKARARARKNNGRKRHLN